MVEGAFGLGCSVGEFVLSLTLRSTHHTEIHAPPGAAAVRHKPGARGACRVDVPQPLRHDERVSQTSQDEDRWARALPAALQRPAPEDLTSDELAVAHVLDVLEGCYLRPNDWQTPYGPMFVVGNKRSMIPEDLTEDDLEILRAVVHDLPQRLLRIRALDSLAFRASSSGERFAAYLAMVTAVADGVEDIELDSDNIDQCERAIVVALRFQGAVGQQGQRIEDALLARMLSATDVPEAVAISDLFLGHSRARPRAIDIAAHLRHLASDAAGGVGRTLREAAAHWHEVGGDTAAAYDDVAWVVKSLVEEAEDLLREERAEAPLHASDALENALKTLRMIPRGERAQRKLEGLDEQIKARIDTANARSQQLLTLTREDDIDLTEHANRARDTIRGRKIEEAVHVMLRPLELARYDDVRTAAEDALDGSVASLFPTIHMAADGRIAARTNGTSDDAIYGLSEDVWSLMMDVYERRVKLLVVGRIIPMWQVMSSEHRLRVEDFHALTRHSPIVPSDRQHSIAAALAYGYNGDFLTAAQLLAPQVENIVRVHLANAGVRTRSHDKGVQNEIGLSSLMEGPEATRVFGDDLAFEIRALFCSPLGPNLRNEYAHGLVGDSGRAAPEAVYAWWLVWKLIDLHFVNALHDLHAADAREPAGPNMDL